MKINPIAIQSYQQTVLREQSSPAANQDAAPQVNSDRTIEIKPQDATQRPRLAVTAPRTTYADDITPEERRALELLFSRFRDPSRLGAGYAQNAVEAGNVSYLGAMVDVKA